MQQESLLYTDVVKVVFVNSFGRTYTVSLTETQLALFQHLVNLRETLTANETNVLTIQHTYADQFRKIVKYLAMTASNSFQDLPDCLFQSFHHLLIFVDALGFLCFDLSKLYLLRYQVARKILKFVDDSPDSYGSLLRRLIAMDESKRHITENDSMEIENGGNELHCEKMDWRPETNLQRTDWWKSEIKYENVFVHPQTYSKHCYCTLIIKEALGFIPLEHIYIPDLAKVLQRHDIPMETVFYKLSLLVLDWDMVLYDYETMTTDIFRNIGAGIHIHDSTDVCHELVVVVIDNNHEKESHDKKHMTIFNQSHWTDKVTLMHP